MRRHEGGHVESVLVALEDSPVAAEVDGQVLLVRDDACVAAYFHGAGTGHKIDALTACSKVSYCVFDAGFRREGEWALNVNSVVVFGRISLVTDGEKARMICENLCRKFTDDEEYIRKELESALPRNHNQGIRFKIKRPC